MPQKRIIISRPDRIGDVVLSTAIPREIKKKHPDAFVALLLAPYTRDIYENNPYVDEILVFAPQESFKDQLNKLRQYKFTHGLMLLPNERINYLFFLAGIKNRIGTGHKFYQFITGTTSVSRHKYIPLRHEADYCMDLARKTGIKTNNIEPEIYLTGEERQLVAAFRAKYAASGEKLIGIHASSGNSAPNLSSTGYAALINLIKSEQSLKIFITDNKPLAETQNIEGVIYPNIGQTLRQSIINFAALDLLVSASTGPMHIASALKVPTVSLFCPLTACSPVLWGPKGNRSEIILPSEGYCSVSCPGDPKKCSFEGEGGIDENIIFERVMSFLRRK